MKTAKLCRASMKPITPLLASQREQTLSTLSVEIIKRTVVWDELPGLAEKAVEEGASSGKCRVRLKKFRMQGRSSEICELSVERRKTFVPQVRRNSTCVDRRSCTWRPDLSTRPSCVS